MINELLELKLSIDEDYECEHIQDPYPDLFTLDNVTDDDKAYIESKIREMIQTIEDNDTSPNKELTRYIDSDQCNRDIAVELYLSTSGHGAGFWDHSTPQADKIQAILNEHHRYETEQWHFYQSEDDQKTQTVRLYFTR